MSGARLSRLAGVAILIDDDLMSEYVVEERPRGWRERWFTWPWRPWQATKRVSIPKAKEHALDVGGTIVMHSELLERMKRQLAERHEDDIGLYWSPLKAPVVTDQLPQDLSDFTDPRGWGDIPGFE